MRLTVGQLRQVIREARPTKKKPVKKKVATKKPAMALPKWDTLIRLFDDCAGRYGSGSERSAAKLEQIIADMKKLVRWKREDYDVPLDADPTYALVHAQAVREQEHESAYDYDDSASMYGDEEDDGYDEEELIKQYEDAEWHFKSALKDLYDRVAQKLGRPGAPVMDED